MMQKKILIIEDEGEIALLLELILKNNKTCIENAKTIASAKSLLKADVPDLIFLDNRLPDGFGVDFLTFLKSNYPSVKIIMISAMDKEAEDVALENGADVFLNKPFTKSQLDHSIHQLVN
jgi:DNA-binding response OmpR family regulator